MENQDISVLLVEHDKSIIDHLLVTLTQQNVHVGIAKDSTTAYQEYLKVRPDIVLTDFETLPETGLDFIRQMRQHENKTRIIVMSSKVDPQFFINSIELGVKGFLLKPIVESQFSLLLSDIIKELCLEKELEKAEVKRLEAEKERDRNERLLEALSQATALFFRYGVSPSNIDKILKLIGKVSGSSRVNLFKNTEYANHKYAGLVYTWAKNDTFELANKEQLRKVPYDHKSISRWADIMKTRKSVVGRIADFAEYERKMLEENGVKSILSVPIYVDNHWWGFLSLDNCVEEKVWSMEEIRAMESVAYNLGAAIYRLKVERDMIRVNESLETKIKERTAALEGEIAERMFAEELLRDREEKYRMIYENAINGILLIQDQKIVLTSPSMVDIMERLPNLLIGNPFCDFIVKDQIEEVQKYFQNSNSKLPQDLRTEVIMPDNENKWLELKTTKISWENRPAFLIFAKDVTLQVKAENELILVNKNLEKKIKKEVRKVKRQQQLLTQKSKLESLGELSAGLAHEINQPLLGISMGLDNILLSSEEEGFSPSYIKRKVDFLFKDIDRIKQIIEHVRTFSRSQQNVKHEKVEMNKLIFNALSLTEKMLHNKDVNLEVNYAENDTYIMGHPYRLEQVILNLLSNAMHAVDEKFKTNSRKNSKKEISLGLNQKGNSVYLKVTDNGVGIPYEILSNIFDPFFTTRNEEKGTGLGLSISYGIIEEMNGSIKVDSIENEYTTVTIKLPHFN